MNIKRCANNSSSCKLKQKQGLYIQKRERPNKETPALPSRDAARKGSSKKEGSIQLEENKLRHLLVEASATQRVV